MSAVVFVDLDGLQLTATEQGLLLKPEVGGVILFSRNTETASQTQQLVQEIRAVRSDLIISIDQEGGRVQRLRQGVTELPPMAALGCLYQQNSQNALTAATELGYLMAAEMRQLDIDLSYAPVLDVDYEQSSVIGDRAFAQQPEVISLLAAAFVKGMKEAGMAAVGKHFPGHGYAEADTHFADAIDARDFDSIWQQDLLPFRDLIAAGLEAIMPAHVLYSNIDEQLAGFSKFWLDDILRIKLNFKGRIFGDDLSMQAAEIVGSYTDRAKRAIEAGCDVLLVCNNRQGLLEVLAYLEQEQLPASDMSLLKGQPFSIDQRRLVQAQVLSAELCMSYTHKKGN